jgi:Cu2+-containing amine oxidase
VKSRSAAEDTTRQDGRYGRFIAENTVAPNHDHFFSFRLDFDLDGTSSSFVRDKIQMKRLPPDSQRESLWEAEPEIAKTEEQANFHSRTLNQNLWRRRGRAGPRFLVQSEFAARGEFCRIFFADFEELLL